MINNHQCKVILVYEPNVQLPEKNDCKGFSFERVYQCNFLDHNQVKKLRNEILQNDGTIDIIIENGKMLTSTTAPLSIFSYSPDRFIEETSNKIIITLNVSVEVAHIPVCMNRMIFFVFCFPYSCWYTLFRYWGIPHAVDILSQFSRRGVVLDRFWKLRQKSESWLEI